MTSSDAHQQGVRAMREGRAADAVPHFRVAAEQAPELVSSWFHLATALRDAGQIDAAIPAYQRVLDMDPDHIEADFALGSIRSDRGEYAAAIAAFDRVIVRRPDIARVHNNRGIALRKSGLPHQALGAFDRAIACEPGHVLALANRVSMLVELKLLDAASTALDRARQELPDEPTFVLRQVVLWRTMWRSTEAHDLCRSFLARHPDSPEIRTELAGLLQEDGQTDAAAAEITTVLESTTAFAHTHNVHGNILRQQGDVAGAIAAYARAVEIDPHFIGYRSNLIFTLQFGEGVGAAEILAENRRWAEIHETPVLRNASPPEPLPHAGRKLRIGYISPYFREHVASSFLLPVLAHHDRNRVEVTCYADIQQGDAFTLRYVAMGHRWRDVTKQSDAELAATIRNDRIDVLVDTALHMSGSRLLVMAHRPAPVQVTWLGYPGTTGMESIDYRLTDRWLDPPGEHDDRYVERSIRLEHPFWCYAPMRPTGAVAPLPAFAKGHVTFGCLNNFFKVSPGSLVLWGRVMAAVPHSRLVLLCSEGRHRRTVINRLAACGIAPDRVRFIARQEQAAYYKLYDQIDVCLDTLPYAGHTTTLDALWMGVPVVSQLGATVVGRAGLSILAHLGLDHLVATTDAEFVEIAQRLVADLPALAALRAGLRARMAASPLMDAAGFARELDDVFHRLAGF